MTQEEKAKAYDKALKQIKECTPDENGFITIYPQEIFPELKKSEDEKIKKDLIQWINEFPDTIWRGHYKKDIIAWLEKRGEHAITCSKEQMKVLDEVLNFAANHENPYWNNYIFDTLNSLIRQLKKTENIKL